MGRQRSRRICRGQCEGGNELGKQSLFYETRSMLADFVEATPSCITTLDERQDFYFKDYIGHSSELEYLMKIKEKSIGI